MDIQIIEEIEKLINDFENVSDDVIHHNDGETLQSIGDYVVDSLLIHEAKLKAILIELKAKI